MACFHHMPFGAEPYSNGVRFRLWAPAANHVELSLEENSDRRLVPMLAVDEGWFEHREPGVNAGCRYRYRIDRGLEVPDPASRYQADDVHGASMVIEPRGYRWRTADWRGRPWHETVIYELHVGSFTPAGTFDGVCEQLDHLRTLGVTALELMPLADFPGQRNWGYDGVLPFAPDARYGTPDDLKHLIDSAHALGLQVFLDVVYNHFGPDGNYLHVYAPQFFTERIVTPWGAGIDFTRAEVRAFYIHNALFWLEEYRFDGLRLDAVHAIQDPSRPDILEELAIEVQARFAGRRHVHLVLENDANQSHYLLRTNAGYPRYYSAQWNDDCHHALHVLATGEHDGYYEDYRERPAQRLARCLAQGFAYQGESSRHRGGRRRGEPSVQLPATAFVNFIQNHDQVGNRALGERIERLIQPAAMRALTAVLLLAPAVPLLFMGQEWAASQPFPFFCDFHDQLAEQVREGRRREFARFAEFRAPAARARIPDPNAAATFAAAILDWSALTQPAHADWVAFHRDLLAVRRRLIEPRLAGMRGHCGCIRFAVDAALGVSWTLGDGSLLHLSANLGGSAVAGLPPPPSGELLYPAAVDQPPSPGAAWSVVWQLEPSP